MKWLFLLLAAVPITNISHDLMEKVKRGEASDVVIAFPQGTKIPLEIASSGDWIQYNASPPSIEALQTFYLKNDGKELSFSLDQKNWKPLTEFITGKLGVETGIKENEPFLKIEMQADLI